MILLLTVPRRIEIMVYALFMKMAFKLIRFLYNWMGNKHSYDSFNSLYVMESRESANAYKSISIKCKILLQTTHSMYLLGSDVAHIHILAYTHISMDRWSKWIVPFRNKCRTLVRRKYSNTLRACGSIESEIINMLIRSFHLLQEHIPHASQIQTSHGRIGWFGSD